MSLLAWFAAHLASPVSDVAIPVWVVLGLALGFVSPVTALAVTILIVPYPGAAAPPGPGELLRVVPLLSAGVRVVLDRIGRGPASGDPHPAAFALAIATAGLFVLVVMPTAAGASNPEATALDVLPWLLGAPVAMVAAWLAASHAPDATHRGLQLAVLGSVVAACTVAMGAWVGVRWLDPFVFEPIVAGRLAAFGYPPPTALGIAAALPIAVGAAGRYHVLAALAVAAVGLLVIGLTGSRGPLLALALGAVATAILTRRVGTRWAIVGVAIMAVGAAVLLSTRYAGVAPDDLLARWTDPAGSDAVRIRSWFAGVEVLVAHPLRGGGYRALVGYADAAVAAVADVHNMVLSAFASGGLPLGLALSGLVAYVVGNVWRHRRHLSPFVIAAAVTFLISGLWDIPHLRSFGAVMGGLALGLASRRRGGSTSPRDADRNPRMRR